MFRRIYTARKEHKCNACPEPILPGQKYEQHSMPAWLDMEADVDDEGRMYGILLPQGERHWQTSRYHLDCIYNMEYGGI